MRSFLVLLVVIFLSACGEESGNNSIRNTLSVSITLDSLPQTITYNKESTPDGRVEYEWGVIFDINSDGAINEGDIILKVLHFKESDGIETVGEIADLGADLWLYTSDTTTETVTSAGLTVEGNTITISIDSSSHSSLESITSSTLVSFETSTHDSNDGNSKYDYFPSQGAVVDIPSTGQFSDLQGDASVSYIDMVSMTVEI